ncbi:MAG: hypothetical protein COT84_01615 [Chlamydiae bacterium CG10_big_fil_rev_8_21_14_0_10_35_9]|nr:MAG: hypothetical protein COT84_01615 [Chlamydiae bacterium CG10_big_fil_rev_8_21_14_0_10_35_9]
MVNALIHNTSLGQTVHYFSDNKMMSTIALVSSVASAALYTYSSSFACFLSLLTATGSIFFEIKWGFNILSSDATIHEKATTVNKIVQIALCTGLISGSIILGWGGMAAITNSFSLYNHLKNSFSAYYVLQQLETMSFVAGYAVPFALFLIRNIISIDRFLKEIDFESLIRGDHQGLQNFLVRFLGRYFASNQQTFEDFLPVIDYLPDEDLRQTFEIQRQNNTLTDDTIRQFQRSRPSAFTFEYLITHLSEDQIQNVVVPQLAIPDSLRNLDNAIERLQQYNADYQRILDRVNAIDGNTSVDELNDIENAISTRQQELNQITRDITNLHYLRPKLPDRLHGPNEVVDLIEEIKQITADPRFRNLYQTLTESRPNSLRNRYGDLSSRIHARLDTEEDDMDEEAYMVLSTLGFRLRDFQSLANHLNLPANADSIRTVSEALSARGLSTRRDLLDAQIVISSENLTGDLNNERGQIISRLVEFINNTQNRGPVLPQVEGPATINRFQTVYVLVNHIYHYTISAALIATQVYYQPISTGVGFIFGLTVRDHSIFSDTRVVRLYQTSPNYISQRFSERARELFLKISVVTYSINLNILGGFLSGVNHADIISRYSYPLIRRIGLI